MLHDLIVNYPYFAEGCFILGLGIVIAGYALIAIEIVKAGARAVVRLLRRIGLIKPRPVPPAPEMSPELRETFRKLDEQADAIAKLLGKDPTYYADMIRKIHAVPVGEYGHYDHATGEVVRKDAVTP